MVWISSGEVHAHPCCLDLAEPATGVKDTHDDGSEWDEQVQGGEHEIVSGDWSTEDGSDFESGDLSGDSGYDSGDCGCDEGVREPGTLPVSPQPGLPSPSFQCVCLPLISNVCLPTCSCQRAAGQTRLTTSAPLLTDTTFTPHATCPPAPTHKHMPSFLAPLRHPRASLSPAVCAIDGSTFPSQCHAECVGMQVIAEGPCEGYEEEKSEGGQTPGCDCAPQDAPGVCVCVDRRQCTRWRHLWGFGCVEV